MSKSIPSDNALKVTKIKESKIILNTIPFDVEECTIEHQGVETDHPFYRLKINDWVNILAVTKDGQAVMIRQDRIGSEENVLEAPGGVVERDEHTDPLNAAVRELEEETGYTSKNIIPLGSLNPNPAINTNNVHYYIALDAYVPNNRTYFPDKYESIEIELINLKELEKALESNKVNHALSALLIYKSLHYIKRHKIFPSLG